MVGCGQVCLSLNQVGWFFDQQYLWNWYCRFFGWDIHQGKLACETITYGWVRAGVPQIESVFRILWPSNFLDHQDSLTISGKKKLKPFSDLTKEVQTYENENRLNSIETGWTVIAHLFPWNQWGTEYLSVFSPNTGKFGLEKLRIWILFMQWASQTFTLSLDDSDAKNNIVKYFRRKSALAYFRPSPERSVNLMLVKPFYFKLKFLVEKLVELC